MKYTFRTNHFSVDILSIAVPTKMSMKHIVCANNFLMDIAEEIPTTKIGILSYYSCKLSQLCCANYVLVDGADGDLCRHIFIMPDIGPKTVTKDMWQLDRQDPCPWQCLLIYNERKNPSHIGP